MVGRLAVTQLSCDVVHNVWMRTVETLRAESASRHETARDGVRALVALGGEGHRGARLAVEDVSRVFAEAVGPERIANGEWHRLLLGAVELAATKNPTPLQHCEHDALDALALPDGFFEMVEQQRRAAREQAAAVTRARLAELIEQTGTLPKAERAEAVRRAIPEIATWPALDQSAAREALSRKSGLTDLGLTEFSELLKSELRDRKQAAIEMEAKERHERHEAAVSSADAQGLLLPPPHDPLRVATALAPRMANPSRWWRGDYYRHDGTRYVMWAPEAVDHWLYKQTEHAVYEQSDDKGPAPWRPTETKIGSVSHALSRGVLYRESSLEPDDSPSQVACSNGVYDVPADTLLPHTSERFNLQSVPFAFDATATAPTWEWFLNDVLPADAQTALQEFFGYIISGRTDLEKIFNLVGRRRSGKGTISTVLDSLVGPENCAAPSMPSLVGSFGEAPLIGKTLATFSDISWGFRDIAEAVEIVKKISGNDARDVNRKNRDVWHGKLGVRFLIMGNDMPKFTDASGALAGRLINIQFPGSFYGREIPEVKTRLLDELPGILNWALAGLARLTANRRFTVPQTSEELTAEIRRQQSPVQGFLDDLCAFPEGDVNPVPLDELFPVYRAWARSTEAEHPLDRERFSRALASAGLRIERKMLAGVRARRVHGIAPAVDETGASLWVRTLTPYGTVLPLSP